MEDLSCSVAESIERTLRNKGISAVVELCNGNIRINGDINAWIRVTSYGDMALGNCVDINSIILNTSIRRRGVFTTLMRDLKSIKCVDTILISSVCTEAMYSWCVNNGCTLWRDYTFKYK